MFKIIDILIAAVIIAIGHTIFKTIRKLYNKNRQRTFIYCPECKKEMVKNGHVIEDNDGIVKYQCSKCGNVSFWDFKHYPVPYLLDKDDLEKIYDTHWNIKEV